MVQQDLIQHSPRNKTYHKKSPVDRSRLIRLPEVISRVGLARSTIYLRINDGLFPAPVKLGVRSVAWLESAVDEWINDRLNHEK